MNDINSGYKRWLLGGIIDKVNVGKVISDQKELEDLTIELNKYCEEIKGSYSNEPFDKFYGALYKKAHRLVEKILTTKKIIGFSKILLN
jgi:hypothetical protein